MAPQLRRVAAAAREVLLDLAAEQGKVERADAGRAGRQGRSIRDGKPSFGFGELTKGKKLVKTIGRDATTTPADEWKVAGTSVPKVDGRAFVTGATPVRLGREAAGHAVRQGAAAADASRRTLVSVETRRRRGDAGRHASSTTAISSAWRRRPSRPPSEALAAITAEWKTPPQPSGRRPVHATSRSIPAAARRRRVRRRRRRQRAARSPTG